MRAESKAKKGKGKVGTIVLFLALPVLLLIVFTYIPFVDMFKNSLTDWDGIYEAIINQEMEEERCESC